MSWNDGYERKKHQEELDKEIELLRLNGNTESEINSWIEESWKGYRITRWHAMHINSSENALFELSRTVNMGQAFYSKCEITPEIVDAFIDEVFVHAQDRIDIHFKTKDLYERALLEIQKTTAAIQ